MEDSELNKIYCLHRSSLEINFSCRSCTSFQQEDFKKKLKTWLTDKQELFNLVILSEC